MKKMLTRLSLMIVMLFTFCLCTNNTEVKAVIIGGIQFEEVHTLREGEYYAIEHTGEEWEVEGASNIGVITKDTNTEYASAYVEMASQKTGIRDGETIDYALVKINTGLVEYKGGTNNTTFWISFINKKTGSIYNYYFYVYKRTTDVRLSDAYLNNNETIYMYEGDSLSTTLTSYIGSEKVDIYRKEAKVYVLETDDLGRTIGVPTDGATVTENEESFTLTVLKEGTYYFYLHTYSDANYNPHNPAVYGPAANYTEIIEVIVRKKPNPKVPDEVYMDINDEKTITINPGLPSDANTEGVGVYWYTITTNYMDVQSEGFSSVIRAKGVECDTTLRAEYYDVVTENNPNYERIIVETKVKIRDEAVSITSNGIDILNTPLDISAGTVNANLDCTTEITEVKSTDTNVATAKYSDGVLTIEKVGPGTATITITTITDNTYTVSVYGNADAPVVKADGDAAGTISWKAINGASSYDVYRATTQNGIYTKIGATAETSFADELAAYGQTYYYKVIAITKNAEYSSDYSNAVATKRVPATPAINNITKVGEQYKVTINNSGNCDGYVIYAENSANPSNAVVTTTTTSATITLTPGTWYVRVRAYINASDEKVYSEYSTDQVVTVKKDGTVIAVTPSVEDSSEIKKVKLTLKKVKGAKKYQVKYSTSKKFKKKNTKVITKKKNKITIKNLNKNKKYYYKYRTCKKVNGKLKWSKWTKVKKLK